mgnify:CR=1 FL=1
MARPKKTDYQRRESETAYVSPAIASAITEFMERNKYRSRSAAVEALLELGIQAARKGKQ